MSRNYLPVLLILLLFSGCIAPVEKVAPSDTPRINPPSTLQPPPKPLDTATFAQTVSSPTATIKPTEITQRLDEKAQVAAYETKSIAVEVDYRKYVDWFVNNNLNIRAYTPEEYVCGQYTVDMINASEKAGFRAYFAAVKFDDGTGHALVSFKSTTFGTTSWYFFEPQTNNLIAQETLAQKFNRYMGKRVTEVTVYGYFDDAGDRDPTTWRFAYPLYDKNY